MKPTVAPDPSLTQRRSWFDSRLRHGVLQRLQRLRQGRLVLVDDAGHYSFGQPPQEGVAAATITIHDPKAYRAIALRGTVGAGEAYMDGHWSADDLTEVIRILARNAETALALDGGGAHFSQWLLRPLHWRRRNTKRGSRANIEAHYDLGNAFYQLFLDPTMTYSCAVFETPDQSLTAAQTAKLERICHKLDLKATDHILEIGSGWGSFALHAARQHGCRVTTTTVSKAQYDYTRRQVAAAGLGDRVTVLNCDYRQLEGHYDKLVSIEMIEAVGHEYLATFFATCDRLLKAEGLMVLQTITMVDQYFHRTKNSVDFIKRYIFPGGCLPSVEALCQALVRASSLRPFHLEDIGPHYATTLAHWRRTFSANRQAIAALGFSERFLRMWEFYFCYCEGGFLERTIGDIQLVLVKPDNRRSALLGTLNP